MADGGGPVLGSVSDIVGREAERARIDAFVTGVPEGPRTLVVRGEPGIGKTTLWRHAVEQCRDAGFQVLLTRPAEEEMPLALGGIVDLFEQFEWAAGVTSAESDPLGRGRGVLEAVRRLAEAAPTVIAIDDVQWLDSASARALRYALRRLETAPVGLLTTLRLGSEEDDPLAVAGMVPPGRSESLELGPLSLGALRGILGQIVASISRPLLRRIHEVSGGNPLYAIELARGLARAEGDYHLWDRLPLPDSLQGAIMKRLERAPRELAALLETVAALGPTSVRELREVLPGEDVDRLLPLAERQALLLVEDDLAVRFAHPFLGSVIYGRMRPLARRSLHARLADRTADPDARARHLALSTDDADPGIAELLEKAAGRAIARGAPDLASEFARHSLRLTPPGDAKTRHRRALAEISYLAAAGEVGHALSLAESLIAALPPGTERAEALVRHAELQGDDLAQGEALLTQALAEAGDDELLRGRVLDELGFLRGSLRGDLQTGLENVGEAVAIAERVGDRQLERSALIALADLKALAGAPRREPAERAIALEQEIGSPFLWGSARVVLAKQLRQAGDLAGARALFEAVHADVVRAGDERSRPYALYDLACLECYRGELTTASDLVRQAAEAARDTENVHVGVWALYPLALVEAWLGRADEARSATGQIVEWSVQRGARPALARARSLLGLLALSEGDAETAARELGEALRLVEEMGLMNSMAVPARPDALEALVGAGDLEAAGRLLGELERHAEILDNPLFGAVVGRCRGVLLAAQGEADAAVAPLERAILTFDRAEFRPDAARAVLSLGRALLRGGHRTRAADAFADARARFAGMGAALWEARAAEELERAAPGRATGELTRTERRVAELVVQGMRNREIAPALFMSVATVEAHLTRIYRKLDIRSRSDLARLVADGRISVTGPAREI